MFPWHNFLFLMITSIFLQIPIQVAVTLKNENDVALSCFQIVGEVVD
jgi:hypothetical protein